MVFGPRACALDTAHEITCKSWGTMNEAHVKSAVLTYVCKLASRRQKPIVTAEFTLGRSGTRADLALFAEDSIGIEIKTEFDTLRRLSGQMEAYSRYFERAIAVVAPKHVERVSENELFGASLWTYDHCGSLLEVRRGRPNSVSDEALVDLLTQAEQGTDDFHKVMTDRYGETSARFWRAVARRSVKPKDLRLLSRFAEKRDQAKDFVEKREARWAQWLLAQGCGGQISQSSSVSSAA